MRPLAIGFAATFYNVSGDEKGGSVAEWLGDRLRAGIPARYVTSQLGQLSLASLRGSLNRVPASAGVMVGMSPLPGGR